MFAEPEIRKTMVDSNQRFLDVDEKYRVSNNVCKQFGFGGAVVSW